MRRPRVLPGFGSTGSRTPGFPSTGISVGSSRRRSHARPPGSAKAFEQIKKLLTENPKLKIYVVGHTDDVGDSSKNVTLSNQRAAAVMKELTTQHKVDAKRLKSYGVGPYVPVASNRNEQGRSKNRRVELVEDVE
jgi:outer membrane protein OmpA-like peptidoglycan-associated protein